MAKTEYVSLTVKIPKSLKRKIRMQAAKANDKIGSHVLFVMEYGYDALERARREPSIK